MRQTCHQHGRTCAWTEGLETVNESNRCAVYARYSSEKQNPLTISKMPRVRRAAQSPGPRRAHLRGRGNLRSYG